MTVELGKKYRDRISGFRGVAIGITEWLYGCRRVGLAPEEIHEGKPIESQWFDEDQVEEMNGEPRVTGFVGGTGSRRGGPLKDPTNARPGE